MTQNYEIMFKEQQSKNIEELHILENRMANHIDKNGDNILIIYPFLIELPIPTMELGNYVEWLNDNFNKEKYLRPWPHLVYFKSAEDAMAFKLMWL